MPVPELLAASVVMRRRRHTTNRARHRFSLPPIFALINYGFLWSGGLTLVLTIVFPLLLSSLRVICAQLFHNKKRNYSVQWQWLIRSWFGSKRQFVTSAYLPANCALWNWKPTRPIPRPIPSWSWVCTAVSVIKLHCDCFNMSANDSSQAELTDRQSLPRRPTQLLRQYWPEHTCLMIDGTSEQFRLAPFACLRCCRLALALALLVRLIKCCILNRCFFGSNWRKATEKQLAKCHVGQSF